MGKIISLIVFAVLLLVPLGAQNALACSTHGNPDDLIQNWEVTPGSALDQFEIRFKNFNTFAYTPSEMCSCGLQVLTGWNIQSAKLVLEGTNTQVVTFPTFTPDSVLSSALETLFPTSSETKWVALKNTIATSSAGGQDVDLVFTGIFPGATQMEIQQTLQGNLVTVGKVNSLGTGFDLDHFESLTILQQAVGGLLLPIETTSLILAGAQMTASWMIPVLVSAVGISLVFVKKSENS